MSLSNYISKKTKYPKGSIKLLDNLLYINNFVNIFFSLYTDLRDNVVNHCQTNQIAEYLIDEVSCFLNSKYPAFMRLYQKPNILDKQPHNKKMNKNVKQKYDIFVKYIFDILDKYRFERAELTNLMHKYMPSNNIIETLVKDAIDILVEYNILPLGVGKPDSNKHKGNLDSLDINMLKQSINNKKYKNVFSKNNFYIAEVTHGIDFYPNILNGLSVFDYLRLFVIDELDKQFTMKKIKTKIDDLLDIKKQDIDPMDVIINKAINETVERIENLKNSYKNDILLDYKIYYDSETKIIIKITMAETDTEVFIAIRCIKTKSINQNNFSQNFKIYEGIKIYTNIITSSRLINYYNTEYCIGGSYSNNYSLDDVYNSISLTGISSSNKETYSIEAFNSVSSNDHVKDALFDSILDSISHISKIFKTIYENEDYMLKSKFFDTYVDRVFYRKICLYSNRNIIGGMNAYYRNHFSNCYSSYSENVYTENNKYPDIIIKWDEGDKSLCGYAICYPSKDIDIQVLFTTDKRIHRFMNKRFEKKNKFKFPEKVIEILNSKRSEKEFYHYFSLKNNLNDKPFFLQNIKANLLYFAPEMDRTINDRLDSMVTKFIYYLSKNK